MNKVRESIRVVKRPDEYTTTKPSSPARKGALITSAAIAGVGAAALALFAAHKIGLLTPLAILQKSGVAVLSMSTGFTVGVGIGLALNRESKPRSYSFKKPEKLRLNHIWEKSNGSVSGSSAYCASDLDGLKGVVKESARGRIGIINGVAGPGDYIEDRARRMVGITEEVTGTPLNIRVVHNQTHGIFNDLMEVQANIDHFVLTEPAFQLVQQWRDFGREAEEGQRFLQFCHSQGTAHTRNALAFLNREGASNEDKALAQRIDVVAIAPSAYIPREWCGNVRHYRVRRLNDPVPYIGDSTSHRKAAEQQGTVCRLKPCSRIDHSFDREVYSPVIQAHIRAFHEGSGWPQTESIEA